LLINCQKFAGLKVLKEMHINTEKRKGHQRNSIIKESGNILLYFWWDVITLPSKEYTMHAHICLHCTPLRSQCTSLFKPQTHHKPKAHSPKLLMYTLAFSFSTMLPSHCRSQSTAIKFQGKRYLCNAVFTNLNWDWQSKHELDILQYHILLHIPTVLPFIEWK
jgi:hypothetical protein